MKYGEILILCEKRIGNLCHFLFYYFNVVFVERLMDQKYINQINNNPDFKEFLSHLTPSQILQKIHLLSALMKGDLKAVKNLISQGTNVDCELMYGITPLHFSSTANQLEIVKYLISRGANIDCKNIDGISSLDFASQKGNIEIVKYLISKGANIECLNKHQRTPLHISSQEGHIKIVKSLVSQGANIECKEESGFTPLHASSQK